MARALLHMARPKGPSHSGGGRDSDSGPDSLLSALPLKEFDLTLAPKPGSRCRRVAPGTPTGCTAEAATIPSSASDESRSIERGEPKGPETFPYSDAVSGRTPAIIRPIASRVVEPASTMPMISPS